MLNNQIKHRVFFSFHYANDSWRAAQIRNIGSIKGNKPCSDNDWEQVKRGGDKAIQRWIDKQMEPCSCVIVLIGSDTSKRKWIKYEIKHAYERQKCLLGIYIHNLKNQFGDQDIQGENPFSLFSVKGVPLSKLIPVYLPRYSDSKNVYSFISNNIANWIDTEIHKQFISYLIN